MHHPGIHVVYIQHSFTEVKIIIHRPVRVAQYFSGSQFLAARERRNLKAARCWIYWCKAVTGAIKWHSLCLKYAHLSANTDPRLH